MSGIHRKLKIFFIIIIVLITVLFIFTYFTTDKFEQFGARVTGERLERVKNSPNYDGEQFVNLDSTQLKWTFKEKIQVFYERFFSDYAGKPEKDLPIIKLDSNSFSEEEENLSITWLGHATVLIEIENVRILTDPIWSERTSFSKHVGPKRFLQVPISISELPELDAVIISHDHFDHLDMQSIKALGKTGVNFYLPLGVGAHFEKWGIAYEQIFEYDWWDSFEIKSGNVKMIVTSARHFSGRSIIYGTNPTLWASWIIIGKNHKVYYSGDTGYMSKYKKIGDKYGPFDITLMAIGAYDDKWADIHLTPQEAVKVHLDLKGQLLIPVHWGTFNLALHDWFEPAEQLVEEATRQNIKYFIPQAGQKIYTFDTLINSFWWRDYMPEK
jgi:L-ascorbate metabolism protein UlaG (beta-lactamase superfamily)